MPSVAARRQDMDAEAAAVKYDCRIVCERKEYVNFISEENGLQSGRIDQ